MFRVVSNRSALSVGLAISVDTRAIFPSAAKGGQQLHKALFDTYRPELHYMRGPGPKWREKHSALDPVRSVNLLPPTAPEKHHTPRLPHPGEWHVPHQGDRASGAFDARSSKGTPRCNASIWCWHEHPQPLSFLKRLAAVFACLRFWTSR
jgi:hypothetical protein